MNGLTSLRRAPAAAALVVVAGLGLVACNGSGDDGPSFNESADTDGTDGVSGEEALAFAKGIIDDTSGVRLTLATDDEPDSDAFLSEASGVITADPPAFEGKASGTFGGLPATDVDIVSVDDTTYVNILGSFQDFPLPKCVPDPAGLLDPDSGVSTVLTDAEEVSDGTTARGGADNDEILTTLEAVVPGASVQNLLPCAPGDEFEASFTLDEDGALRSAALTGSFFPDSGDLTYTITIEDYDVTEEITAP